MRVFPSTVGFAVLVEHHSGNSVVRPKIADLVERRYRGLIVTGKQRRPHRIENRLQPWGNCTVRAGVWLIHVRASLLRADTALQEFRCARRAVAFVAISIAYPNEPDRKVPIRTKGGFYDSCLSVFIAPHKV